MFTTIITSLLTSFITGAIAYYYKNWRDTIALRVQSLATIRYIVHQNTVCTGCCSKQDIQKNLLVPPMYQGFGYVLLDKSTHDQELSYLTGLLFVKHKDCITADDITKFNEVNKSYIESLNALIEFWNDILGAYYGIIFYILPFVLRYVEKEFLSKNISSNH